MSGPWRCYQCGRFVTSDRMQERVPRADWISGYYQEHEPIYRCKRCVETPEVNG